MIFLINLYFIGFLLMLVYNLHGLYKDWDDIIIAIEDDEDFDCWEVTAFIVFTSLLWFFYAPREIQRYRDDKARHNHR